jgi:O-Antigen ligase
MERAAKLVTLVSVIVAIGVEAWFVSAGWNAVWPLTLGAFGLAACLACVSDEIAAALVLLLSYTFPAVVILAHHRFYTEYGVIWMAAVVGSILPRTVRSGWAVPMPWRPALILWALTVAFSWPVVVLRELDFSLTTLHTPHLASSLGGNFPQLAAIGAMNVAVTLGIGILWFDWLFLVFRAAPDRFRQRIVAALAVSWLVAIAVAGYQLVGDLEFVSAGIFASVGRATATMADANAFGMVAAVWGAAVVALVLGADPRPRWWLVAVVVALSWIGLWASGSRTALLAGVITLAFLGWYSTPSRRRLAIWPALIVVASAIVVLLAVDASLRTVAIGPVQRFRASLPDPTVASTLAFLKELWARNSYGAAATVMVREHPLVGVGVGSFYILVPDYSKAVGSLFPIPPDNAQNWYRHQFAEFGLLGSIGWILWTVYFGWFMLVSSAPDRDRRSTGILKGALVALALVSLVGMPTQNTAVALTFWTMAFWISLLTGGGPSPEGRDVVLGRRHWTGMCAILCLFIGGTAYAARHDLRVSQRAARAGWPYSYGFYEPERSPDGGEFRWTQQRAVTVLSATKRWMHLAVSVNHRDLADNPVDVRVWRDEQMVINTTLRTTDPAIEYVRVPDGRDRFVLETWVSRVVRPVDVGMADARTLGLMVQWDFVDAPPAGVAPAGP